MLLKIKVLTSEKKEGIALIKGDKFEVKVKAKPKHGLANERVKEILAKYFNLPNNKIRLIKGFKRRNKIYKVEEIRMSV